MQAHKTIKGTIRDLISAYSALSKITEKRGMPDSATSLSVGMTMRSLREVQEDSQDAHKILMTAHAQRDEDGNIKRGADPQTVELEDPSAFLDESRDLLAEEREIKIYPVAIRKVIGGSKKATTCPRCKQQTGMPDPEAYATLIVLGILTEEKDEDKADAKGEGADTDKDRDENA